MKRTIVIELYSGPSGGKSTEAADLYAALKRRKVDAELSREYVKRWALKGYPVEALDEFYIFGKQVHEESDLLGRVDVVVTDRPVMLSIVYAQLYCTDTIRCGITQAVRSYYAATAEQGHRRIAVLLPRRHRYRSEGRFEDEDQARLVDATIENVVGNWELESYALAEMGAKLRSYSRLDGLYCYDDGADFCDGSDVAVDVCRMLRR